jgi:hypothetical protein
MNLSQEYERDYYAWLEHQVQLLKTRQLDELDEINLAEELEGMSKAQRHELINQLRILLAHLLKWQYEPSFRLRSWLSTIREQRIQIQDGLEQNPSLQYELEPKIAKAYDKARAFAADETGLAINTFPTECPYTFAEIMNEEYYPQ